MSKTYLTCQQCGDDFIFSEKEQERCDKMGFDAPRRCPECRKKKTRWEPDQNSRRKSKPKKKEYRHRYDTDDAD